MGDQVIERLSGEPGTDQPAAGEGVLHRRTRPPSPRCSTSPRSGYPEEHGRAEPPGIPEDPVGPLDPDAKRKPREQFETDYAFPQLFSLTNWKSPITTATGCDELRLGYPVPRRRFGEDALVGDLRPEGRRADRPFRLSEMLDIDVARFIQAVNLYAASSTAPCRATSVSWKTWSAEGERFARPPRSARHWSPTRRSGTTTPGS